MISKIVFWWGFVQIMLVSWAGAILGKDVTAPQRAEGYAMAACTMIFAIGLHLLHHHKKEQGH